MTEGIWQAKHSWSVPAFQSCGITPWCISGGASCYEDGHPCFRYSTLEKKYDLKLALDVSQPLKLEMTGVQVEINTGFVLNKKVTEENCCWNRAILYLSAWSCAPLLSFSVCLSICARIAQNPGGNRPRVEYGREAIAFLWRWTKQVKVQVCWGGNWRYLLTADGPPLWHWEHSAIPTPFCKGSHAAWYRWGWKWGSLTNKEVNQFSFCSFIAGITLVSSVLRSFPEVTILITSLNLLLLSLTAWALIHKAFGGWF